MNRAEELRHYITDAQATIAITMGDLAAELAAASNGTEGAAKLRHLIVTQFADVIDLSKNAGAVPPHWFAWLSERHPLPSLVGTEVHRWQDLLDGNEEPPALATDRNDLALLPYTSGTTGSPKGCMLSHASVMHNAMTMSFWLDSTPEMVSLAVLPLFHITGLVCVMHASIFAGVTLVIMPRWDRDLAGQLVSERRVTHWTCIPTMIIDLLASPRLDRYDTFPVSCTSGAAVLPCRKQLRSSYLIASTYGWSKAMASQNQPLSRCSIPVMHPSFNA